MSAPPPELHLRPRRLLGLAAAASLIAALGVAAGIVSTEPAKAATTSRPDPQPSRLTLAPQPVSVQELAGSYTLNPATRIVALGDAAQDPADYLARHLRPATGYALPVVRHAEGPAPIVIEVAPGQAPPGHSVEGYTLTVQSRRITIKADTANGALDGIQTLRQMFPQWIALSTATAGMRWTVPDATIVDYPRFEHRGMTLDVARSFYPVAEVEKYIDDAAQFKVNTLHLHLSDDQGWRIAINNPVANPSGIDYSLLTGVSGATAVGGSNPGVTGYYTQADYTKIIRYAAQNGMTVVPEIDMPAHIQSALHAIPQLNTAGAIPQPAPGQTTAGVYSGGSSSLDPASPTTYEFVNQVLSQLAALTPGPYLEIGGDEAGSTSDADYATMVNKFTATVHTLGKTVVGWNEYSGTNLPQNDSVIQYWYGSKTPVANAVTNRGAKVILSPAANTYVPQKQDSRQPQGATWACGGPCGLDRYYNWDPGTYIPGISESSVLGVETALWGEFIRGIDQAEYYTYPRIIATAEVGWTAQNKRDFTDFKKRLAVLGGRLTLEGTNFFPSADVAWQAAVLGTARAAQAGQSANASWTVTAPGQTAIGLPVSVTWSDGVTSTVTVTTTREADIPAMHINDRFTVTSNRTFSKPGRYSGVLTVNLPGQKAVQGTLTVCVN